MSTASPRTMVSFQEACPNFHFPFPKSLMSDIVKSFAPAWEGPLVLDPTEIWWRDNFDWFQEQGLTLRDRYKPDWVPSWKDNPHLRMVRCEDSITSLSHCAQDALRQDGKLVVLKRVRLSDVRQELEIGRLFCSEPYVNDPNNYCVPFLDVLQVPHDNDFAVIVMPLLYFYDVASVETIGEGVELIRQLLEGLNLMHDKNIAHRDVKYLNILADLISLFDAPPHAQKSSWRRDFKGPVVQRYSRTIKPVKHYLIDFGLSKEYKPEDAPHLEPAGWGGDHSVPEFRKRGTLCDPFPVDVYCMGNFIRMHFTQGNEDFPRKLGFEFLNDLVNDMVQEDPAKRPSMKDVVSRYMDTVNGLSSWKLRSRAVPAAEKRRQKVFRGINHWIKQAVYVVRRIPAIPRA